MDKNSIVSMRGNYLTTREAARILGVSVPTVQQWVDTGKLTGWVTRGGHRRLSHESVMDAMDRRVATDSQPYRLAMLIVEDDLQLIKLYRAQIKTWPFEVQANFTPNGYEALVLAGEINPSMLVCDLRLPGINGLQIVRALTRMDRFSRLRIVVVTGWPLDEIQAHGGLPENVEVMGKPIDFKRLMEVAQDQWRLGLSGPQSN